MHLEAGFGPVWNEWIERQMQNDFLLRTSSLCESKIPVANEKGLQYSKNRNKGLSTSSILEMYYHKRRFHLVS